MRRKANIVVKSALIAVAMIGQMSMVGAYWVCDYCGCHVNHENCWFYNHPDICHPDSSGACYLHLNDGSCSGPAQME